MNKPAATFIEAQTGVAFTLKAWGICPGTRNALKTEHAFLAGLYYGVSNNEVPAAVLLCMSSGRSILTVKP